MAIYSRGFNEYIGQNLNKKWNDWELNSEADIRNSNSIFFQSHDLLDIV